MKKNITTVIKICVGFVLGAIAACVYNYMRTTNYDSTDVQTELHYDDMKVGDSPSHVQIVFDAPCNYKKNRSVHKYVLSDELLVNLANGLNDVVAEHNLGGYDE